MILPWKSSACNWASGSRDWGWNDLCSWKIVYYVRSWNSMTIIDRIICFSSCTPSKPLHFKAAPHQGRTTSRPHHFKAAPLQSRATWDPNHFKTAPLQSRVQFNRENYINGGWIKVAQENQWHMKISGTWKSVAQENQWHKNLSGTWKSVAHEN